MPFRNYNTSIRFFSNGFNFLITYLKINISLIYISYNRWRRGDECILGVTGSGRPALRCARSAIFRVSSTSATMGLWKNCL
jgi:hypothetical protein